MTAPGLAADRRRRLTAMWASFACGVGFGVLALVADRSWVAVGYAAVSVVQLWRGVTLLADHRSS